MALADFFSEILSVENDRKLDVLVESAISSNLVASVEDESSLKRYIKGIEDDKFTVFGNRLSICIEICQRKIDSFPKDVKSISSSYKQGTEKFRDALVNVSKLIEEIGKEANLKLANAKTAEETALEDNERKLEELNKKIKNLDDKVNDADKKYDNKIFTLLINTVAILGIFVAIAFTGFGSVTIFSNLEMSSEGPVVLNTFYILLIGTIIYNVLLMLIYFVFKICFYHLQNSENGEKLRYSNVFNLTAFIWIDIALTALTIGFAIASIITS